ncbi:hypothetical protein [Nannocystis sp.]|uniref:hypothetical protein n=1 Tax=Nannocystis sp. TaxID=1962667 RepID=UPI0025E715A9|nr:hypothetical protein [Nannocystis sp.]MBK7828637.1 hypothetical protein [Nannocystis sp.]
MSTSEANGRLYRVGKHWYLDTALLQTIARRMTVEPMQGGYQILAPAGLVRCVPASGLALPGQTGELYRCQGQSQDQDIGARLRKLAGAADVASGEWEQWPSGAMTTAPARACCGSCAVGGACGATPPAHDHEPQSLLERLIVSETLGTVAPRMVTSTAIAIYPAQHAAPEWVTGRYHECIASILRFPDLAANDWIVLLDLRKGAFTSTWGLTLDRQRTLMLTEILQLALRLADQAKRKGSALPAQPSKHTPGASAWEFAAELAPRNGTCERCPYRLGTNLRCPMCRQWQLRRKPAPAAEQPAALATLLREQKELRTVGTTVLNSLAQAIADSHARNPHEPLTDRFFLQLERDVLLAQQPHRLAEAEAEAVLDIAELSPLEATIAVGAQARKEAA